MPHGSKEDAYKNADSLSYLTTEQALADYSVLLTDLKRNLSSEDSPVVLFGGSYGGSKLFFLFLFSINPYFSYLSVGITFSTIYFFLNSEI